MFHSVRYLIKKYPFFLLLIALLSLISIVSIKPEFHLLGWDNYSSYFNLKDNLIRTFFATWREHRGLGVPSDSEVTDIFRQLFFFVSRLVFPETILDQLYFILSLILGVVSMYIFAYMLFTRSDLAKHELLQKKADLFAFIAAFFYLFNLNTLSVFYFPIQPYISRFFAIPFIFLIFFIFFSQKKISLKIYFLFVLMMLFAATSYMIGTVFITLVISLILFSLLSAPLKRVLVVFLFFFLVNSFWILPFVNYTIQKSSIIRLAPTFIDANEFQLNKPKQFYSLDKQLILFPNFFETDFSSSDLTKKTFFHYLSTEYSQFPQKLILFIFPTLFIIGSLKIIARRKIYRYFLWAPILIGLFLFLSMKEFSIIGFAYSYLNKLSPIFGVLFRFGDTKFHPFIAFGGSIAAAVGFIYIITAIKKLIPAVSKYFVLIFIIGIGVGTIFVYRSYFKGDLIGFFMYNKVPDAYFKIAKTINESPSDGRVLHIPYDKDIYWRSYAWGYLGSEFLGFMINKPLIDKTFEPASMENAYFHKRAHELLTNMQSFQDRGKANERAYEFYQLLYKTGVKYIVLDETVSAEVQSRGVVFWGTYDVINSKIMMATMESLQLARKIKQEEIKMADYKDTYSKIFPLSDSTKHTMEEKSDMITLYELKDVKPKISFINSGSYVDPAFNDILQSDIGSENDSFIQDGNRENYDTFLFKITNERLLNAQDSMSLQLRNFPKTQKVATVQSSQNSHASYLVDLVARADENKISISLFHRKLPDLLGDKFITKVGEFSIPLSSIKPFMNKFKTIDNFVSNWHVLPQKSLSTIRLRIDGTVIPIPEGLTSNDNYIGSVIVHDKPFSADVVQEVSQKFVNPNEFAFTDNPNCFFDKLEGYTASAENRGGAITVRGKNGSICYWRTLNDAFDAKTSYIEVQFDMEGESKDLDRTTKIDFQNTAKPKLKQVVTGLDKPLNLRVCIKEGGIDQCLNSHQMIMLGDRKTYIFPIDTPVDKDTNLLALLSLKNIAYQEMQTAIHSVSVHNFEPVLKKDFSLQTVSSVSLVKIGNSKSEKNTITFPKPMSRYSFYFKKGVDSYYLPSTLCDRPSSYRTQRILDAKLVSWVENCQNSIFESVPFSSDNFYIWSLDYNLASGQYPTFKLEDGFNRYVDELASSNQGYPDIREFKLFQEPEVLQSEPAIRNKLNSLKTQNTYIYINSNPGFSDFKEKNYTVEQYTENEGMMVIKSFDIIELPNTWENIRIIADESKENFDVPSGYRFKKILPSLWKIELKDNPLNNKYLLQFNEGYDREWSVYGSEVTLHTRCDGYANCFILNPKEGSKKTFYIFYWPEVLAILGWFLTLITILFNFRYFTEEHQIVQARED